MSNFPAFYEHNRDRPRPDPEVVQEMLEDVLVLLGNANVTLNVWRQRCFLDYLPNLGTLRGEIPIDRHLFPHQCHEKNKE